MFFGYVRIAALPEELLALGEVYSDGSDSAKESEMGHCINAQTKTLCLHDAMVHCNTTQHNTTTTCISLEFAFVSH